jgi:hypothetical protein
MAISTVRRKKFVQPRVSASRPEGGPAKIRGRAKRLERRAYCVAEKRFSVRRSSMTPWAPVPRPLETYSKVVAVYRIQETGPDSETQA